MRKQGLIFIICGPSGSGKTTLLKNLLKVKELKHKLARSISFTTRPKRSGEKDGKDYFFISRKQFLEKRQAKKLLEWTKYLDYYYATDKDFIEKKLKDAKHIVLCLDFKGVLRIRQLYPKNTITIFIKPPSLKALKDRIKKRCNKTKKAEIQKRIKLARFELNAFHAYDYVLLNKDLAQVTQELRNIILGEIAYGLRTAGKTLG